MKRGDVWWVNFDPSPSAVKFRNIATVSKVRLLNHIGRISDNDMKAVELAIKTQLAIL